ncbi:carbohydrate ABC transporter permease [Oceanobacillus caeni]|uniref:carbohydrate ABC transporter permease n=1 Tax=Oceanobacillus caeni TaxID=405946 RepID=UPI00195CFA3B
MKNNGYHNQYYDYFKKISFILPALLLLLLLTAYPLYQVIVMSFYDYSNTDNPIFAGAENYARFFRDPLFWKSLINTIVFTVISVAFSFIIGMTFALLLNQPINTRFRAVFRSVLIFPWLTSSTVVAAIFMLMFNPFGLINHFLGLIGIDSLAQTAWLGNEKTALASIIVANIWRGFPFMMLMLLAGLQTIPKDLYEAAELDGAGFFKRLFYITIPSMKNIILTLATLEFIWNFRAFDLVFLMTGGGPMNSTEILSTYIYQFAFRKLDFGYASAAALFMLFIMVTLSFFYIRKSVSKGD